MSAETTTTVHVRLAAPLNTLLMALQDQLNTVRYLEAAATHVTEAQVLESSDFMRFEPWGGVRPSFNDSRTAAYRWLANGFLRDAVEAVGIFLDDYIVMCEMVDKGLPGRRMSVADLDALVTVMKKEARTLHFPIKMARLEKRYGLRGELSDHVMSLNKARTCLVHRLGRVSVADAGVDGALCLRWNTTQIVAVGLNTGKELIIDRDDIPLPEESSIQLRFVDCERTYKLGQQIDLDSRDVYNSIVTFYRYAVQLGQQIQDFMRGKGIHVRIEEAPQLLEGERPLGS